MEVSVTYARAHISQLLKAVASGEWITITRRKQPMANLVPANKATRPVRKLGTLSDHKILLDPHAMDAMTDEQAEQFIMTGDYK